MRSRSRVLWLMALLALSGFFIDEWSLRIEMTNITPAPESEEQLAVVFELTREA